MRSSPPQNRKEVANALSEVDTDPRKACQKFGLSCALPGPWLGPLALVFQNAGDFKRSVVCFPWALCFINLSFV